MGTGKNGGLCLRHHETSGRSDVAVGDVQNTKSNASMSGRTRRAVLAFITAVGGQGIITLAGFVATPVILRLTSEALYGYWLTTLSILGYLALTELGLGTSFARAVAALAGRDDPDLLNRVISSAFFSYCAAALLLLALGEAIAEFIPGWFHIPDADAHTVVTTYRLAVLASALFLPLSTFAGVVIGFQRMAIANVTSNLIRAFALAVAVGLLHLGVGLPSLALGYLFSVVVDNVWLFMFAGRCFPHLRIRPSLVNRADIANLVSYGGYFQLSRVANTVAQSTDTLIIAAWMGAASVTPYALTSKLAVLFSITIAGKLPDAAFPALSQMFACDERRRLKDVTVRLTGYAVRLAIVAAVFLAVANRQFITLWVGPQYYAGAWLNAVFVYWVLQDTISRGMSPVMFACGGLRRWAVVSIGEAVINLVTSVLLVGPLGLMGVALGTSIGKTLTTAWYLPYAICQKVDLPPRTFVSQGMMLPALRSTPGVLLAILTSTMLSRTLGWLWILAVGVVAVAGNVLCFEAHQLFLSSGEGWQNRLRRVIALPTDKS
jgi:membrane protein EpsK